MRSTRDLIPRQNFVPRIYHLGTVNGTVPDKKACLEMRKRVQFKAKLLLGVAFSALLVGGKAAIPLIGHPPFTLLAFSTASIAGPWAPHGIDSDYSTTSVHGESLTTVSGTFSKAR